jgi:hypothetical protein
MPWVWEQKFLKNIRNMDQLLIETIIEKIDSSEARLDRQGLELVDLSGKVSGLTDQASAINNLADLVKELQKNMIAIRWPVKEMEKMSERMAKNNDLLSNPRKTRKIVFHTAGRLIWVIIGLFIGIGLLTIGWINTSKDLEKYQMNDILWRYVKTTNRAQNLIYFQDLEKMYVSDPDKMQSAVEKEELRLKQLDELSERAIEISPSDSFQRTGMVSPALKKRKVTKIQTEDHSR